MEPSNTIILIPVIEFTDKQRDQIQLVWETFSFLVRHGTVDIEEPILLSDLVGKVIENCTKPSLTQGEMGECHEQGHQLYDHFITWIDKELGHNTYVKYEVKS